LGIAHRKNGCSKIQTRTNELKWNTLPKQHVDKLSPWNWNGRVERFSFCQHLRDSFPDSNETDFLFNPRKDIVKFKFIMNKVGLVMTWLFKMGGNNSWKIQWLCMYEKARWEIIHYSNFDPILFFWATIFCLPAYSIPQGSVSYSSYFHAECYIKYPISNLWSWRIKVNMLWHYFRWR